MERATRRRPSLAILGLLLGLYAVLAAGYFVGRYAGRWTDSDTVSLSASISATMEEGTLRPTANLYGLGFGYQGLSTVLATITGLSVVELQFWAYPFVAAVLSVVAFILYRALTGDSAAGALAALLLFLQPDFLFVIFRGSHEKVTWLAAMLAVYALARSFRLAHRPAAFSTYVALFYLAVVCLIGSNVFFGSSFILAVAVSLAGGLVLLRVSRGVPERDAGQRTVVRLMYVLVATMVVWFLVVFYFYPPAGQILRELQSALDRVLAVGLGREPTFDPYATVGWGWTSPTAYLGLTLPSFVVAGLSFVVWVGMGLRYLRRREGLLGNPPRLLLWLLYGGFGVQMAIGIVLDRAGSISGNLQHRLFPVVMLMAFPLVASGLTRLWREWAPATKRRWLVAGLLAFVVWASVASLLKATNDPSLSNYWTFWTVPEDAAVRWTDLHLRDRSVWLGLDSIRLGAHARVEGFGDQSGNRRDAATLDPGTRHILLSQVDEDLSVRRMLPLPDVRFENQIYDGGRVGLYHLRPWTPYQR